MRDEEKLNQGGGNFPPTHISAIVALGNGSVEQRKVALGRIIEAYWAPVYKYLRLRWRRDADAAADLTQGFFLAALEKEFLSDYDPVKARFRTFLRVCLDRYVQKDDQFAGRQKRGGGLDHLSLNFAGIENELSELPIQSDLSPEELFEKEWIRNLFASAVEELRERCKLTDKSLHFEIFERYDLQSLDSNESVSYRDLAKRHNITVEAVTNHLSMMRRAFREMILDKIRDLNATEEEYRDEVKSILGTEV